MTNRLNVTPTRQSGTPAKQLGDAKSQLRGREEFASRIGRSRYDRIFHALADPTRRSIFERMSRGGELTVRELVKHARVTQQAVARHLSVLQVAGLVTCRHNGGRTNYYSARPLGAVPLLDWLAQQGVSPRDQKTTRELGQRLGTKTAFDAIAELRDAYAKAEARYMAAAREAITDRTHAFDRADAELLAAAERAIQTAVQRLASSIEAAAQDDRTILEGDRTHVVPDHPLTTRTGNPP